MKEFINILGAFLAYITGQPPQCDYYQQIAVDQTYYAYSPNYPGNFTKDMNCRWTARCPEGYNCQANCTDIMLTVSPSCEEDKFLISSTGDVEFKDAHTLCGAGSTAVISDGQYLTLGLQTGSSSKGGRFICQLTAVPEAKNNTSTCSCGYKKRNRIVGGEETQVNEYPMMAGLVSINSQTINCGAVIIAPRLVLTAAHCVEGRNDSELAVVVGEHDVTTGDSPATRAFRVAKTIVHSQYNGSDVELDYDIALVEIDGEITFSERVGPACLPFKLVADDLTGKNVTALGWGDLGFGGPTTDTLHKVELQVISDENCRDRRKREFSLTPRQFCTFAKNKDTCQRDSGGPLLFADDSGVLFNVGIVSYGTFCASDDPGLNTRVTALLDWITENTPNVDYCRK